MNPNEPIRDARKLGTPKMLVLGLQHMFAMFGATILVPILVQQYGLPLDIQTTLFFAGIGTLFFHVCTKFRVPAFLGSSFAFLGGFSTMANLNTGIYADMSPQDKLADTCGGIVVAGLLYLALALVIRLVGVKKVMRFLPPVVTGPIIVCIGLTLAPSAVSNASTCWPLALIALATIIIFNIWEGDVQDHPHSDGRGGLLYRRPHHERLRRHCAERRRRGHPPHRFHRRARGQHPGPAPLPDGQV